MRIYFLYWREAIAYYIVFFHLFLNIKLCFILLFNTVYFRICKFSFFYIYSRRFFFLLYFFLFKGKNKERERERGGEEGMKTVVERKVMQSKIYFLFWFSLVFNTGQHNRHFGIMMTSTRLFFNFQFLSYLYVSGIIIILRRWFHRFNNLQEWMKNRIYEERKRESKGESRPVANPTKAFIFFYSSLLIYIYI